MPFLSPNQQRQSTEGKSTALRSKQHNNGTNYSQTAQHFKTENIHLKE